MADGDAENLAAIRTRAAREKQHRETFPSAIPGLSTPWDDIHFLLARVGQLEAAIGAFVADADFVDAPVHYASTEAYAWAAGFDSGKRATRRAIAEQLGEAAGVESKIT